MGTPCGAIQQIIIQVINLADSSSPAEAMADGELPNWCKVYEGLTDEEIDDVEVIVLERADLSRSS